MLSRAEPFYDTEGKITKWFGTDINEQRLQMQQKDDFISIASHELKTPLTTLKASMQLVNRLKDNPANEMLPNLIERSSKSVEKIYELVDDLLNVSKLNQGQLHINKSLFTLSEVIADCCNHVRVEGKYYIKSTGDMEF